MSPVVPSHKHAVSAMLAVRVDIAVSKTDGRTDMPAEKESQLQAVGTGGSETGHPLEASALGGIKTVLFW